MDREKDYDERARLEKEMIQVLADLHRTNVRRINYFRAGTIADSMSEDISGHEVSALLQPFLSLDLVERRQSGTHWLYSLNLKRKRELNQFAGNCGGYLG